MANSISDLRKFPVTVGDTILVLDSFNKTREGVVTEVNLDNEKVKFINRKTGRPNTADNHRMVKVPPRS